MNTPQTLLDADDAAKILLLSARRVRTLVRDGHLPHIVLPGGEIRFDPRDLESWVVAHKQESREAADAQK
ncbi:MAG: helix-turn-helix domain-containing protein [Pirellulaceae bacterium]|nr:helix-turn-helix domain-containing protein [Pirellulaceae bacterium]